jgi:hypothetical protein
MALPHGAVGLRYCPRRGQYRKETLIARFGGDVLMPDVRHLIADARARMRQGRLAVCTTRIPVLMVVHFSEVMVWSLAYAIVDAAPAGC